MRGSVAGNKAASVMSWLVLAGLLGASVQVLRGQNDHYPIRGADQLSPPSVQSPIYKCARAVAVYGFIPGATVDVFANVSEHLGQVHAPETYAQAAPQVMLSRPLKVGDVITATQTYQNITSKQSFNPVTVGEQPAITTPVVDPDLWECGQVVNVHNLRASTHVEVQDLDATPPGSVIGTGESTSENLSVVTSKLVAGHHVVAIQMFCPGKPDEVKSKQSGARSVPAAPRPPGAPSIDAPIPGSHTVLMHSLFVGAAVEGEIGSTVIGGGIATAHDNLMPVAPPLPTGLPAGEPTVIQSLCDPSPRAHAPPEVTSLPPVVLGDPICEGSHFVTVWNARPGATVILVRGGIGIGYGSGSIVAVGGGITLNAGDDLTAVQAEGFLTSPESNHVIVGCGSDGSVVTQHNDNNRSGVYPYETQLTPAQVLAHGMSVKYTFPVKGSINAQPLYVRRVPFKAGPADGLFICDTGNNVYGIDANTGVPKWAVTVADSNPGARPHLTTIDTTPVIDRTAKRIYVVFSTNNKGYPLSEEPAKEAALVAQLDSAFWLVALDYTDGHEVARTRIAASLYRNNGEPVSFDARFERHHAALLLDHGTVYVAFCSIAPAEWTEFHGWVMAYRSSDLGFVGAWCASKNFKGTNPYDGSTFKTQGGSGIWEGGGGLSADPDGNVYFLTGNGEADLAKDEYGDCLVKLRPTAAGLIAQAYVPPDAKKMFEGDADAGSGGTLTIPGTGRVIGGGKTGYMFLLDRSSMTAVQPQITAATSQYPGDSADHWRFDSWYTGPHLHGSPTFWRGPDPKYGYLYVWGEKDYLRQYRFNMTSGKILEPAFRHGPVLASDSPPPGKVVVMPGGIASLSSDHNKAGSGILWSTLPHNDKPGSGTASISAHLYAFHAETLKPLWDTSFPSLGHWLPPTIADGKVFIGTGSDVLIVYQLGGVENRRRRPWQPVPFAKKGGTNRRMEGGETDEAMMFLPARTFEKLSPPPNHEQFAVVEGEGTEYYVADGSTNQDSRLAWRLSASTTLGQVTRHRALTPEKGRVKLSRSGDLRWTASDGSSVVTVLERAKAAPDDDDAGWALYRVTRTEGEGLLAGVTYVMQAFTRGGAAPMSAPRKAGTRASEPYHAQIILYKGE